VFDIVTYFDRRGRNEIEEYLDELSENAKKNKDARIKYAKVTEYIKTLKKYGTSIGYPEVRKIKGGKDLWELRPLKDRIFFAYWKDDTFVLLHHFVKKSGKTPPNEIVRAENELKDWLERNGE
jgi:phage-related protein